jgi:CDP-glucose 4,6-dehydratase
MFGGFYHGRRVLVTGDTGFKGSWLCLWLRSLGATVSGFALPPATSPALPGVFGLERLVEHRDGDLRDAAAVSAAIAAARPEVVFHLAAQPLVRASYADPKGTFDVNVGGTVNVLEAIRASRSVQAAVIVTTDKCYENREWCWGYRESDALGGHDPYSASKGAAEIAVASWRRSFFASGPCVASARAGNVIGGGDWAKDRIVTDFVESIRAGRSLALRNPQATRPWQHVLEPLSAYLHLAWRLASEGGRAYADAWNFGPDDASVITVEELARALVAAWGSGEVVVAPQSGAPHEAGLLKLDCSKASHRLGWRPTWDVREAIQRTVDWYRSFYAGGDAAALAAAQIDAYAASAAGRGQAWASAERTAWTNA